MTDKQKRFCEEYLANGLNATKAAIDAGYSQKTAYSIGNENLKKPEIQDFIKEKLSEKDAAAIAKQDEILKTLTRVLRREEKESVVVTLKSRTSSYDKSGKKRIVEKEAPQIVEIPSKLSDTNKAAELLGRYYAMFTDNLNADVGVGVEIIDDIPKNSG